MWPASTKRLAPSVRRTWRVVNVLLAYRIDEFLPEALRPSFVVRMVHWLRPAIKDIAMHSRGARLRLALQELGPIFVKFGQILSTRRDLLPGDIADELSQLQDRVAPFPGELARQQIESALGGPISSFYATFDPVPLASASIAQVHPATLHDGREVVIKVLRPNVQIQIEADLALLWQLARIAERRLPEAERIRPLLIVAEIERSLIDELDLQREAANGSLLRRNFTGNKDLQVPEMVFELSRTNILTMQRVYGVPLNDLDELKAIGVNFEKLASKAIHLFYTQVFRDNFFHADVHPGNLLVSRETPEDPSFIALDFGIMGQLPLSDQRYLAENFLAMFRKDYRRVAELHIEAGWMPPHIRVDELEGAVRTVCEPFFARPLSEISLAEVLVKLFALAQRHELIVQPQLLLLQKTLLNIEGLSRTLFPKLDIWSVAHPVLAEIFAERYGWRRALNDLTVRVPSWIQNAPEVPRLMFEMMKQATTGQQRLEMRSNDLKQLVETTRAAQRQTVYAILGAGLLVVATLTYLLAKEPLRWFGMPVVPVVAILGGIWAFAAALPKR